MGVDGKVLGSQLFSYEDGSTIEVVAVMGDDEVAHAQGMKVIPSKVTSDPDDEIVELFQNDQPSYLLGKEDEGILVFTPRVRQCAIAA